MMPLRIVLIGDKTCGTIRVYDRVTGYQWPVQHLDYRRVNGVPMTATVTTWDGATFQSDDVIEERRPGRAEA